MDKPIGASVDYSQDFSMAPISVTFCNKGLNLTDSFPELASVDFRPDNRATWVPVWSALLFNSSTATSSDTFIISNSKKQLHVCMRLNINSSSESELRIRHFYNSDRACKLKNMAVYLHGHGLFLAQDFTLPLDKSLFDSNANFIIGLTLEASQSLPTEEFNCSQIASQTLDSCLIEDAWKASNQSAECVANYLK